MNPNESKISFLENKFLLIYINFIPKTSHSCLKKWYTMFSRFFRRLIPNLTSKWFTDSVDILDLKLQKSGKLIFATSDQGKKVEKNKHHQKKCASFHGIIKTNDFFFLQSIFCCRTSIRWSMDLASVGGAAPKLGAGGNGNDCAGGGGEAPSALRSESIFLRQKTV